MDENQQENGCSENRKLTWVYV